MNLLNQFWAALALKLGLHDLGLYQLLFGAGYYLTAPLLYGYCGWLCYRVKNPKPFLFALISLSTCSMPSEIFAINQALTTVALCWVIFHYLVLDLKITKLDLVVISLISVLLFRSHEGMILWGTSFAAIAGYRIFLFHRQGEKNVPSLILILGLLGILQAAFAGYWQITQPVQTATQNFIQTFTYATPERVLGGIGRLPATILVMLFFVVLPVPKKLQQGILILGVLGLLTHALNHFGVSPTIFPMDEYGLRLLIPFASPFLMMFAALANFAGFLKSISSKFLITVAAAGLLALSLWQIGNNFHWRQFNETSREVLRLSPQGTLVPPQKVYEALSEKQLAPYMNYSWDWTWSVYGLNLQNSPEVKALYLPLSALENFKVPTDPNESVLLPFIHFSSDGYFQFQDFLKTCAESKCTGTLGP